MHAVAAADLQDLQELLRARRAELAEARRLESIERERERRASLAQRRHWQISGAVLKVALITYQLARASTEPVVVYLRVGLCGTVARRSICSRAQLDPRRSAE